MYANIDRNSIHINSDSHSQGATHWELWPREYVLHMCAKSAKGRIHAGGDDSQRHLTKALMVLLPAPHVREVSQGENVSRQR